MFLAHLCKQSQAFPPPKKEGKENSQQQTNESTKVSEVDLSVFQAQSVCVFPFSIFLCCAKNGDQPEEDLAKSGYKTQNKEQDKSRNHIGEPLKRSTQIWRSQKKKARNLPKYSKNLGDFITFFLDNVAIFSGNFLRSSLDHVAWDFFFNLAKWRIFRHNKIK